MTTKRRSVGLIVRGLFAWLLLVLLLSTNYAQDKEEPVKKEVVTVREPTQPKTVSYVGTNRPVTPHGDLGVAIGLLVAIGVILLLGRYLSHRESGKSTASTATARLTPTPPPPPPVNPRPQPVPSTRPSPPPVQRMPKIFLSYRREDSADVTGRIYDRLLRSFPRNCVFKDVDSIPLGVDFRKHLDNVVAECNIFLAIIGDRWINARTSDGRKRLDDPCDFVRIEIESALNRKIAIVPILVRDAKMPSEEEMPQSLRLLIYRNGLPVRPDPDFHKDMDRLIAGIEQHLRIS